MLQSTKIAKNPPFPASQSILGGEALNEGPNHQEYFPKLFSKKNTPFPLKNIVLYVNSSGFSSQKIPFLLLLSWLPPYFSPPFPFPNKKSFGTLSFPIFFSSFPFLEKGGRPL